jgi:hypothetical protein
MLFCDRCYSANPVGTNFNPVLGETFQYTDTRHESPVKIFCEQVSHHPHLAAMHGENDNWRFYQNYGATAEYLGMT